jgi:hypothetical protein
MKEESSTLPVKLWIELQTIGNRLQCFNVTIKAQTLQNMLVV